MRQLEKENIEMANQIEDLNTTCDSLKKENKDLKIKCNLNFLNGDALNQYGRRESFRPHNIPEIKDNDKPLEEVVKIARKLGIDFSKDDVQRCHRVGKKRDTPRQIIVKMRWFKKRMDFITNKKKLRPDLSDLSINEKKNLLSKSAFITEDLSP